VDFSITEEQQLLVDSATKWARTVRAGGSHRSVLAGEAWPVDEYWKVLADNGWLGIVVPEEHGGSGGTLLDACLLVEVMHRELVPLPFAANAVLVPALLQEMPSAETSSLLAKLATGARRIALGVDPGLGWPGGAVAWDWTPGDHVAVVDGGGIRIVSGDAVERVPSWDLIRPTGRISAAAGVSGASPGPDASRFLDVTSVVSCAAIVGLMDGALDLAVEYARTREQYGRPNGAFQAVQHLCADMYVDLEAARAAYLGATAMVQDAHPSGRRAAAVAKAWCAEAGVRVTQRAVQVLGGIGNTWESDAHLYLRGAHQWGRAFCDLDSALDLVVDGLLEPMTGVSS
jgi:alkylation response protein AidB-like acyl-CoA dehydrogenase